MAHLNESVGLRDANRLRKVRLPTWKWPISWSREAGNRRLQAATDNHHPERRAEEFRRLGRANTARASLRR